MSGGESYPKDWRHVMLQISPDGKDIHSDGNRELGRTIRELLMMAIARGVKFPLGEYPKIGGDWG